MSSAASDDGGPRDGIPLDVGPRPTLRLWLRKFPAQGRPARARLLVLHGGYSSGDTFLLPEGGLADDFARAGWEVWVLEWRGSPYVINRLLAGPLRGRSLYEECLAYNMDSAAEWDLPAALDYLEAHQGERRLPLVVLGHCVGSGVVTLALARGHLVRHDIAAFVLCELGLFVEATWNGWLKPEDFILERALGSGWPGRVISPREPGAWPQAMKDGLDLWPKVWLPPRGETSWEQLLHHLSFMVGQPYTLQRLAPSLRGGLVESVFGGMHLGIYLQAAQSVRRGYLSRFNAPDIIDRGRLSRGRATAPLDHTDGDLDPTHFVGKRIVLVAPGQSRVWHRDCIDLMYEWLRSSWRESRNHVRKLVFAEEGLQELFWGNDCGAVSEGIRRALDDLRVPVLPG